MHPVRCRTLAVFLAATCPLSAISAEPDSGLQVKPGDAVPDAVVVTAAAEASEAAASTVAPAAAVTQAVEAGQTESSERPKVYVMGARQNYRALSATGTTKSDTLLKDLLLSVRVLTADLLKDAGVTSLASGLDRFSGPTRQSNQGGLWDSHYMPGLGGSRMLQVAVGLPWY